MSDRVTLLLAHASSYCPEIWDPIVHRLRDSPFLQQKKVDVVRFTCPYHGSKSDHSIGAELYLDDPQHPRVDHPLRKYNEWGPEEIYSTVQKVWKEDDAAGKPRRPIIGIGHSLGAAILWICEAKHPGTFTGLALFEPMTSRDKAINEATADSYVPIALSRQFTWPTREAAEDYFDNFKGFRRWDKEAINGFVRGGLVKANEDPTDTTVMLALHPHAEAASYCSKHVDLTDEELAGVKCLIVLHGGERSRLYQKSVFENFQSQWPDKYVVGDIVPGGGHLMVMEDPESTTERILTAIQGFPPYKNKE